MFKITRLVIAIAALVIGSTTFSLAATSATPAKTVAQASPAPTATPNPFSYRGYVRAYDFTRQNAYTGTGGAGKVNQQSFNAALNLHADYALGQGFSVGGSYLYANPLNSCTLAANRFPQNAANICSNSQAQPNLNPDDTLPGFQLSTLYEAYLKYKGNGLNITAGDQVYNTPWANASDSRLKPVAFQGIDATYQINKLWAVQASWMPQWECRTCSNFDRGTLLTDLSGANGFNTGYPGATALQTATFDPSFTTPNNNGLWYGRIGYTGPKSAPLTANASFYNFTNIAQLFWLDASYPLAGKLKPFIKGQFGSETNPNPSILGKISSTVYGLQGGFNPLSNITITAGFDVVPVKSDQLSTAAGTLPAGYGCSASHTLTNANKPYLSNIGYFLMNGAPQCVTNPDGSINLYYGGLASPYTDSYATDPLFTTEISQGMADRRAPGQSFKLEAKFVSDDKRFTALVNKGWYVYGNSTVGVYPVQETDFDTTYYFKPLPKSGPYHGFFFRYRYADRDQAFTFAGGQSLFKYNRFQAEYDF